MAGWSLLAYVSRTRCVGWRSRLPRPSRRVRSGCRQAQPQPPRRPAGIENADGSIAFQYLFREPWLATGQGIAFKPNPPGQGSVAGTVTCQATPVAGATVTVVGSNASIRTAVRGSALNRQFVVEWRNVRSYEDPLTRITFQAILDEAGGYGYVYTDNDGAAAIQYTYRQPVLHPGLGLRFNPPTP